MFLFAINISSLVKCPLKSFAQYIVGLVIYSLLSFESFEIYSRYGFFFGQVCDMQIFYHSL